MRVEKDVVDSALTALLSSRLSAALLLSETLLEVAQEKLGVFLDLGGVLRVSDSRVILLLVQSRHALVGRKIDVLVGSLVGHHNGRQEKNRQKFEVHVECENRRVDL